MLSSSPRSLAVLIVAVALFGVLGCAQERAPINQVQANALAKSFFVGDPGDPTDDPVFYWRNFVVDGSEAQELIGIGSWSAVDRVQWEITENTLYARRAYPQNTGEDDKGTVAPDGTPNGTIVAAYPITSHFDIKRAYNPQTGEELNIIQENTTDRPWYERDYFRVDWSMNQVETPDWIDLFLGKIFGDVTITPISYYVSNSASDDAPHFEPDSGYFDVTSKFLVQPANSTYASSMAPSGTFVPECVFIGIYTGNAIDNCDAQEAVIRSSYWRVDQLDPDQDFEPFVNTQANLDIFGNPGGEGDSEVVGEVTPPRVSWDPGYGYVDPNMTRYMSIHNIWQQSHQKYGKCSSDAECPTVTGLAGSTCLPSGACTIPCTFGTPADSNPKNGTDDQCENKNTHYAGNEGSQCSAINRCTIPYRDRVTKPITWWVNTDMPDELQDTLDSKGNVTAQGPTEEIIQTWNQAIRAAVGHAREVECRRTGGARADCHGQYFTGQSEMVAFGGWGIDQVSDPTPLVVLCHDPVRDYDPDVCGARGATARVGDIRRNFIFYWPFASRAPWGGIADWNADPLTGQIVGAAATVMGRSATSAAAQIRDVIMVANKELDLSDITGGVTASIYQQHLQNGVTKVALTPQELQSRIASVDFKNAQASLGITLAGSTIADKLTQIRTLKMSMTSDPSMLASGLLEYNGIIQPLIGSTYESQLVDPAWLVDADGMDPGTPINDALLATVSPLRGHDPAQMNLENQSILQALNNHGVCDFAPDEGVGNPDIRGVAKWFGDPDIGIYGNTALEKAYPKLGTDTQALSNQRAELIYDHLWKESYKGIVLHEIGHGLGMFHNFASSYDAPNFDPQYWQLRTNEGAAIASCNGQPRTGTTDTCMGPRYLDPETDDEQGQAAESRPGINYFGNTSTMEYQNERFFESVGLGQYDAMTMGALYGRVLETFDPDAPDGVALSDQPNYAWLNLSQLTENDYANWDSPEIGLAPQPIHYTELARRIKMYDPSRCRDATPDEKAQAEWRIVHGKVCSPPPKDHASWIDFVDTVPQFSAGDLSVKSLAVSPNAVEAANDVRWPYRWGQTNNAYAHINPSDAGADFYEVVQQAIEKFDYSYPFNYFRRQRSDWSYPSLPNTMADRFYERLRSIHWVIAHDNALIPQISSDPATVAALEASDNWGRPAIVAETDMLNVLARAIVTPEIGSFAGADESEQVFSQKTLFDALQNGATMGQVFTLDASEARFVDPVYDGSPTGGGSWNYFDYVEHAGFDVEKQDASMALTDGRPTLAIIQRDTYIDGRHLNVNFRTDLPKAVDRVIGGIVSSDWQTVAADVPTIQSAPEVLDFTAANPTRPAGATLLFPNLGYRQQLGTMIWAASFSQLGTDLTLADKMRVYLDSTEGVINIPDSQKVEFSDPRTGYTYIASKFGPDTIDGVTIDSGIGSRMIARANALLAKNYQVTVDTNKNPILDQYGRPTVELDANGQPIVIGDPTIQGVFSDYVGLLDTTVKVVRLMGFAPPTSVPSEF